jgi:hypothetical protein
LSVSNRSITIQAGETLELTSRGSTEWDVTGGSAAIRYQATMPLKSGATVANVYAGGVTYNTINAYMGNGSGNTAGSWYLGTTTGTATVCGTAFLSISGQGPNQQGFVTTLTTTATQIFGSGITLQLAAQGDNLVANFTDVTNNAMYRFTGMQTSAANTSNYSMSLEQIA